MTDHHARTDATRYCEEAWEARETLRRLRVNRYADFHELSSSDTEALANEARRAGYRKPKDAPGSTARMFFQRLTRRADRPV